MLDQRVVAGVGNIFKSEGCFAVSLDPWRPVSDLTDAELERLLDALRNLVSPRPGSSTDDNRTGSIVAPASRCTRCGAPVQSYGQGDANRITYWCRSCQG